MWVSCWGMHSEGEAGGASTVSRAATVHGIPCCVVRPSNVHESDGFWFLTAGTQLSSS